MFQDLFSYRNKEKQAHESPWVKPAFSTIWMRKPTLSSLGLTLLVGNGSPMADCLHLPYYKSAWQQCLEFGCTGDIKRFQAISSVGVSLAKCFKYPESAGRNRWHPCAFLGASRTFRCTTHSRLRREETSCADHGERNKYLPVVSC